MVTQTMPLVRGRREKKNDTSSRGIVFKRNINCWKRIKHRRGEGVCKPLRNNGMKRTISMQMRANRKDLLEIGILFLFAQCGTHATFAQYKFYFKHFIKAQTDLFRTTIFQKI